MSLSSTSTTAAAETLRTLLGRALAAAIAPTGER